MKKILFVIDSLHCGGAEKSLVTLLNNLDDNLYQIDLHINTKGGEFEKFVPKNVTFLLENIYADYNKITLFIARVKYWYIRKIDSKKTTHLSQHFWKIFGKKINKNVKKYDVAIAYGQGFPTYYVSDKVTSTLKYSWLNTDHQKAGYNASFDYKKYKHFKKIIAVSNESKLSLDTAMKNINKELNIEVIRDIVDKDFIHKMSKQGELLDNDSNYSGIKILTVCRLEPVKGLHLALEACEMLYNKGKDFKWYIVGEGSERSTLEAQIKEKGLDDYFILKGFNENPYSLMKQCDIYVQSSLYEGLGMTVIEASCLNKPIVTTNFPTAATIIEHNKTGIICEMNPTDITEGILKYIEDDFFTTTIVKKLSEKKDLDIDKKKSLSIFHNLISENTYH